MPRINALTVYDRMEAAGVFTDNPANPNAYDRVTKESTYRGPLKYPMMLYSPKGEMIITNPGEWQETLNGPKQTNVQQELVHEIAHNEADEKRLRAEGWWDHPALAHIAAGRKAAPPPRLTREPSNDDKARRIALLEKVLRDAGYDPDEELKNIAAVSIPPPPPDDESDNIPNPLLGKGLV